MGFYRKLTLAAVAASGMVLSTAAFAAEHVLTISSWAPPTHGINAKMWPNFIKMIEEATDGRVTAELKLGLAPPPAQMDLVQDGAADLSIIFHGYQAGRFTTTKLIELPGYDGNAEKASAAYWAAYDKYLKSANEHKGVKVIALHTHGPAQLHSSKKISSLSEIDGLKLRVPGGVGGDVGSALGATGIKVPAPKVYETLASKAADGVVMPFESRKGFKLTEVAQNVYELPGGLYRGSFAFIMNEDKFNSLPEDLQKALEEKVFGAPLSAATGAIWDEIDTIGRDATNSASDNAVVKASDADMKTYDKIAADVRAKVLEEVSGKGIDAQAAYDLIVQELAK
ncbi:MAG: TRAP transporter substrate-binding protein [Pseudomonadota bacterium]